MRHATTHRPRRSPIVLMLALCAAPVAAQITNGSFESGLTGWTPGPGANVEVLQASNFGPDTVAVPDGSFYALLSTGPGNTAGQDGDFDANGRNDFDASTLTTTFTTTAPNEILSFQWLFLTDEIGPGKRALPLQVTAAGAPDGARCRGRGGGSRP